MYHGCNLNSCHTVQWCRIITAWFPAEVPHCHSKQIPCYSHSLKLLWAHQRGCLQPSQFLTPDASVTSPLLLLLSVKRTQTNQAHRHSHINVPSAHGSEWRRLMIRILFLKQYNQKYWKHFECQLLSWNFSCEPTPLNYFINSRQSNLNH